MVRRALIGRDVLQDEEGQPVVCLLVAEQAVDVRVIQPGEDLSLSPEAERSPRRQPAAKRHSFS